MRYYRGDFRTAETLELGKDLNLLPTESYDMCKTTSALRHCPGRDCGLCSGNRWAAEHEGSSLLDASQTCRPWPSWAVGPGPTLSLKAVLPVKLPNPFCPLFLPIFLSSLCLRRWLPWSRPSVPTGRALVPAHWWLVSCSEQETQKAH